MYVVLKLNILKQKISGIASLATNTTLNAFS